ncbi:MAG: GNAT family N-acetyltransferase [Actinobacteria bacterium]|nr:GNAT family N-acetyltransferase [Actinomycetota bacterium]
MSLSALRAALPDLTVRPPATADAAAVTALIAACELDAHGEVEITEEEVHEFFALPSVDIEHDVVVVNDGPDLVGYADVNRARATACVAPSYRGRGIGTALARWTQARARALGFATVGQTVSDLDLGAGRLLEALGARQTHTAWVLRLDLERVDIPAPSLPAGHVLRDALPEEERAVFDTIETAFSEWPGREPGSFEDWVVSTTRREGWQPWMAPVVVDPGGRIVGVATLRRYPDESWVDQLAVASDRRREGIGIALLHHAFGVFRGLEPAVGLSTDSRTGALDLYLRAGMHVRRSYTRWTFDLADEQDASG